MTARISEAIHKWMGWCPVKAGIAVPKGTQVFRTDSGHAPNNTEKIFYDRIVDISSVGTSLLRLLAFGIGIAAFVFFIKFISVIFIGADVAVLCGFLLFSAFVMTYSDFRRTTIESGAADLTLRRPLFRPVIIQKNQVTDTGICDNRRPVPQWLMAAVTLIIIPAYSIFGIYSSFSRWISGDASALSLFAYTAFFIAITLFFLAIFKYSHIRYKYPKTLVISTKENKKLVIYGKDPEELAEIQEKLL